MEVRTRATTSVTTESDRLTSLNLLILFYQLLRHVSIGSLQTIVVADNYILTISSWLVFHDADLTTESSTDGVADINLDVKTFMLTSPTSSEVRGEYAAICWHMETSQIDTERIWESCLAMCIDIVPVLIEVG